jgi:hypothetical protein
MPGISKKRKFVLNLQKATILVLVGLLTSIVVKTTNIIFPHIYEITFFTRIFLFLSIFRSVAVLIFVIYFYREYITEKYLILKQPTIFIFITTSLLLLIQVRHIVQLFTKLQTSIYEISPLIYQLFIDRSIYMISPIINWLYLLSLVYFIFTFYVVLRDKESTNLLMETRWAIVGSVTNLLLTTFSMVLFYFFKEKSWISVVSQKYLVLIVFLFLIASFTLLYFLWHFYKSLPVKIEHCSTSKI